MATLRVILKQRWQGQEVRNSFHVAGGDAVQSNAQGIIDYFRSAWATNLQSQLSTEWEMYGASAKELDIVTNPTIDYGLTAGKLVGSNAGDPLAAQNSLLITWICLTARPNRGRTYLAGFTEAAMAGGIFAGGALAAAGAWATAMLDVKVAYPGLTMTVTRVSKPSGILVGSNIIDTFRNPGIVAIQRSRRLGQGQ